MMSTIVRPAEIQLSTGGLQTVQQDGENMVVFRPAVESIGLNFVGQLQRLRRQPWATVCVTHMVAEDGKTREMVTVPEDTFIMWAATLQASRVAPELRPMLVAFQTESKKALHAYWTTGRAIRPTMEPKQLNRPRGMTVSDFRATYFCDVSPRQLDRHLYERGYLIDQRNSRINARGQIRDGYKHRHPTSWGSQWFQLPEDRFIDANGHERGGAVIRPDRVRDLVEQLIEDGLTHNATISRAPERKALGPAPRRALKAVPDLVVDEEPIRIRRGA